jgi:hypothetical protein
MVCDQIIPDGRIIIVEEGSSPMNSTPRILSQKRDNINQTRDPKQSISVRAPVTLSISLHLRQQPINLV